MSDLSNEEADQETIVSGIISRNGKPVDGAGVRLLDSTGKFNAEVSTNRKGEFRFFAAPGTWTVRTVAPEDILTPSEAVDKKVVVLRGEAAKLSIELPAALAVPGSNPSS